MPRFYPLPPTSLPTRPSVEVRRSEPLDVASDATFLAWVAESGGRTLTEFAYYERVPVPLLLSHPAGVAALQREVREFEFVRSGSPSILPAALAFAKPDPPPVPPNVRMTP